MVRGRVRRGVSARIRDVGVDARLPREAMRMSKSKLKSIVSIVFLCGCVLVSLWLRVQGASELPTGQFTETDAYLYYDQARTIAETGRLPARDMRRWYPLGRDTTQTLNLYPYAVAAAYRLLVFFASEVTLYGVAVYAPGVCFSLTLAGVSIFLWWIYGFRIAGITAVVLATLPATIERSAAGFGDRDAWCLMLGTFAVVTYLSSVRAEDARYRLLWRVISGFLMFLGGVSWEGFVVFVWLVLSVWVWRFLTRPSAGDLLLDAVWVLAFLPALLIASPAYRSGVGVTGHLFALMLLPPVVFIGIRGLHAYLIHRSAWAATLTPHARRLAMGLTLVTGLIGGICLLFAVKGFDAVTVSYSQAALWQSIGELRAPHFGYWLYRYGSIFIIGSLGLSVFPLWVWGRTAVSLSVSLLAFTTLVFFRHPLDALWGRPAFGDAVFLLSLVCCVFHGLKLTRHAEARTAENTEVFTGGVLLFWGLVFISLARDAKRFDFFIGLPLAFFTAFLISLVAEGISDILASPKWTTETVRAKLRLESVNLAISGVLVVCALFWGLEDGGHILRSHAATRLRTATPGKDTALAQAFGWMREHLPRDAVVAAEWSFGSHLNVLAGVKTITDADHYLPHWIDLYQQHVRSASSEQEALEFLKTHGATHLMITPKQPAKTMLSGLLSEAFLPVYPEDDFQDAAVKVWELRYPALIQTQSKYLQTRREK